MTGTVPGSGIEALGRAVNAALAADPAIRALVGADAIGDAPPRGRARTAIVLVRHDVLNRDADLSPLSEHRLTLHARVVDPSRAAAASIAERIVAVLTAPLMVPGRHVVATTHLRTETEIDGRTGGARAAVFLRILLEPKS